MRSDFLGASVPVIQEFNEWVRCNNILSNYRVVMQEVGWDPAGTTPNVNTFSYKHIDGRLLSICAVYVSDTSDTISTNYWPMVGGVFDKDGNSLTFTSLGSAPTTSTYTVNLWGMGEKKVTIVSRAFTITTTGHMDLFVTYTPRS